MGRLDRRPSPAMIVALIALFVALGALGMRQSSCRETALAPHSCKTGR
jgi:hypothetical protein